jgi:D-alanyl-D-alanine endopeptidase (penicillin-binding protein 7)
MGRSALGIIFSLFFASFIVHNAWAAGPSTVAAKKSSVKKTVITKKKAVAKKKAKAATSSKRRITAKKPVAKKSNPRISSKASKGKKVVVGNNTEKVGYQRVTYAPDRPGTALDAAKERLETLRYAPEPPELKSNVALVIDQATSEVLFEKNAEEALPIASITKLMTSLVVVESNQDMNEWLTVTDEDIDREKNTYSRLRVGSQLTRANMLHIALMSSENRAASALGRHYPGGMPAFVKAMNAKAAALGMTSTRYVEPTGLSSNNVSNAHDLAKLVMAAYQHPIIRRYSTDIKYAVDPGGRILHYTTSNHLVRNPEWDIGLQKTGYISEAGRCLVMQANIEGRPIVMIFLDAKGKLTRTADAVRIRKWLESTKPSITSQSASAAQG